MSKKLQLSDNTLDIMVLGCHVQLCRAPLRTTTPTVTNPFSLLNHVPPRLSTLLLHFIHFISSFTSINTPWHTEHSPDLPRINLTFLARPCHTDKTHSYLPADPDQPLASLCRQQDTFLCAGVTGDVCCAAPDPFPPLLAGRVVGSRFLLCSLKSFAR